MCCGVEKSICPNPFCFGLFIRSLFEFSCFQKLFTRSLLVICFLLPQDCNVPIMHLTTPQFEDQHAHGLSDGCTYIRYLNKMGARRENEYRVSLKEPVIGQFNWAQLQPEVSMYTLHSVFGQSPTVWCFCAVITLIAKWHNDYEVKVQRLSCEGVFRDCFKQWAAF